LFVSILSVPDTGPVRTSVAGATPWSAIDAGERPVPPGKEPRCQQAEDEPADVGGERDAAPFAGALNSPKLASMSWYKNHSPKKIQAGIRTRKIGKIHVRIRDPG
jgi:hypothetical protein